MENDKMEKKFVKLNADILSLIEIHADTFPSYEIVNCLISNAVNMMLFTAPNHLLGIKTILACLDNAIINYQEIAEEMEKNT